MCGGLKQIFFEGGDFHFCTAHRETSLYRGVNNVVNGQPYTAITINAQVFQQQIKYIESLSTPSCNLLSLFTLYSCLKSSATDSKSSWPTLGLRTLPSSLLAIVSNDKCTGLGG
jgi:hypothetical protein